MLSVSPRRCFRIAFYSHKYFQSHNHNHHILNTFYNSKLSFHTSTSSLSIMSAKLWGSDPNSTAVIRQVTEDITTVSVPFLRVGVLKFGGRGTIAKMSSGGLLVFSPTPLTDEVRTTVSALGNQVSYIVAPDIEHHLNLGPWKAAFPAARVIGPQSLYLKRQKQHNEDVTFDFAYTAANKTTMAFPDDFNQDFEIEYLDGHVSDEIAVLHKRSGTVMEADLLFNLPSVEQFSKTDIDARAGVLTRISMSIFTSLAGKAQQRFVWYYASKNKT
ncbi:hypothetical protein AA313_de0205905 [Arthrobotrys entomopaga]|nr:hypothetical protein AA313_de0205905 [Arthrobotrys entomopaga]